MTYSYKLKKIPLLSRPEFRELEGIKPYKLEYFQNTYIERNYTNFKHIFLQGHQTFVSHFMRPETSYKNLLLKYSTGSGRNYCFFSNSTQFFDALYRNTRTKGIYCWL